jgi:DNA-binding transcriptional ArsR family regulator
MLVRCGKRASGMENTSHHRPADAPIAGYEDPNLPAPAASPARTDDDGWPGWSPLPGQLHHVDHRWLRHINRALVLACLRDHGPISRVEIAERTDLSRTTVSTITNALLREGASAKVSACPRQRREGAVPCCCTWSRAAALARSPQARGRDVGVSAPPGRAGTRRGRPGTAPGKRVRREKLVAAPD